MLSEPRTAVRATLALIAAATLFTTAGCASSKSSGTSPNSTSSSASAADPALVAQVPASYKAKGTITFASDATYEPNEYINDSGAIAGFDVDLGTAIAAKLGLQAKWTNVSFDNILGGVQSGTYDAGMSSFTDNKSREGQGFMFVDYFTAGTSLMVAKGNPENLQPTGNSLCGKTVGVESGTTEENPDITPTRNNACKAAGLQPITTLSQQTQTDVNTSLQSGRCDAVLADSPVAAYYAKNGPFEVVGASYSNAPYGIAIYKSNTPLAQLMVSALKDLSADGQYTAIATKWGVQAGDVTSFGLNGATS